VVGAPESESGAFGPGKGYVFERGADNWAGPPVQCLLASDGAPGDSFGTAVAIDGDVIVVGAQNAHLSGASSGGAAYVFERNAGGPNHWGQTAKLVACAPGVEDFFGATVAISGEIILVGAPYRDSPNGVDSGAVYAFSKPEGAVRWVNACSTPLTAADTQAGDLFGTSVSITRLSTQGDLAMVIGAQQASVNGVPLAGAAYVFQRECGTWTQTRKLISPAVQEAQHFGAHVDISGTHVVVGLNTLMNWGGAAYVFDVCQEVSICSANPPRDNSQFVTAPIPPPGPFRDVLQDVFCLGQPPIMVPQGIGGALTLPEGPVSYSPIHVTFNIPVVLTMSDVSINCSYYTALRPCPSVSTVTQMGDAHEYTIRLGGPIPPGGCTSLTFNNINPAGQAPVLKYEFLPGDVNMSGASGDGVNTADLVALVHALQDGTANLPGNLARYDINRNGAVNTEDLLRLVQILNGVCSTRAWNGAVLVPCP
jgi:hypothetical protein